MRAATLLTWVTAAVVLSACGSLKSKPGSTPNTSFEPPAATSAAPATEDKTETAPATPSPPTDASPPPPATAVSTDCVPPPKKQPAPVKPPQAGAQRAATAAADRTGGRGHAAGWGGAFGNQSHADGRHVRSGCESAGRQGGRSWAHRRCHGGCLRSRTHCHYRFWRILGRRRSQNCRRVAAAAIQSVRSLVGGVERGPRQAESFA